MATTVTMPQLGESVVEGTVVRWIAKLGQKVERDGPLVEVATDKANTEVPSPTAGVLVEVLAKEGAVVPVGAALCQIDEAAQAQAAPKSAPPPSSRPPPSQPLQSGDGDGHLRASPVVRNVAQEHGIDLEKVSGSGVAGRITKADVLSYLDRGGAGAASSGLVNLEGSADSHTPVVPAGSLSQPPPPRPSAPPPPTSYGPPQTAGAPSIPPPVSAAPFTTGPVPLSLRAYRPPRYTPREGDQVIPFDHRRRLVAEHMVYSKVTSPQGQREERARPRARARGPRRTGADGQGHRRRAFRWFLHRLESRAEGQSLGRVDHQPAAGRHRADGRDREARRGSRDRRRGRHRGAPDDVRDTVV